MRSSACANAHRAKNHSDRTTSSDNKSFAGKQGLPRPALRVLTHNYNHYGTLCGQYTPIQCEKANIVFVRFIAVIARLYSNRLRITGMTLKLKV
jgi:hypothetical protein